jgi:hypothetical protein
VGIVSVIFAKHDSIDCNLSSEDYRTLTVNHQYIYFVVVVTCPEDQSMSGGSTAGV